MMRAFTPSCVGYALGSVEGKVAVEMFDLADPEIQKRRYAFKAHRRAAGADGQPVRNGTTSCPTRRILSPFRRTASVSRCACV